MTSQDDLNRLYRETVLDHSRNPRNFRRIEPADRRATGHNPLCGDKVTLYVKSRWKRVDTRRGIRGYRLRDLPGVRVDADRARAKPAAC